jgi:hypothetical protein
MRKALCSAAPPLGIALVALFGSKKSNGVPKFQPTMPRSTARPVECAENLAM